MLCLSTILFISPTLCIFTMMAVCDGLEEVGVRATFYHADLDAEERKQRQVTEFRIL